MPWQVTYALLWYVLSFAPNLFIGFIDARRTRAVTLGRALVLVHLMIAWNVSALKVNGDVELR